MNRQLLFLVFLTTINSSLFSQSVTITNIQVSQRTDGSGLTDIYFDLAGTASAYYIAVEASFNGGTSYSPVPSGSLSGNTGPIGAGAGKHIVWNGRQSFPNTYSTQAKVKLIVTTTLPAGSPCPGTPTIVHGGQTYNTVQIGTQCWLKENLNIGTKINGSGNQTNNGTIEKYCYGNLESNCNIYGGFYQWNEMMQYVTTAGVQGICPAGWHIPTDAQWTTATTFLGGTSVAGGKMKTTGTIEAGTGLWYSPNTGATNESWFTAVPTGFLSYNSSFYNIGKNAYLWSSTMNEVFASYAWYREMRHNTGNVFRDYTLKDFGFSVRCLRDF